MHCRLKYAGDLIDLKRYKLSGNIEKSLKIMEKLIENLKAIKIWENVLKFIIKFKL